LPAIAGITWPTARAAPVEVGIMLTAAARARRRSLCGPSGRHRHAGHFDLAREEAELWGEPVLLLGAGPLVEVDTTTAPDILAVAADILCAAGRPPVNCPL
jgi:hypothetical protein